MTTKTVLLLYVAVIAHYIELYSHINGRERELYKEVIAHYIELYSQQYI